MPGEVNEVNFLEWEETFFEKIGFYDDTKKINKDKEIDNKNR